jgi:hypothetical protein
MEVKSMDKPVGQWCVEIGSYPGSGCTIYDNRPQECRDFECIWLQSQKTDKPWPMELKPNVCRVVFSIQGEQMIMFVDPQRPAAVQNSHVRRAVDNWIQHPGHTVMVVTGPKGRKMIKGIPIVEKRTI